MEERTDPIILKLLFAVTNYVDAKQSSSNPFVKGFSRVEQDVDVAYRNMVYCLNNCEKFYPEMEKMFEEMLSDIPTDEQTLRPQEPFDTIE